MITGVSGGSTTNTNGPAVSGGFTPLLAVTENVNSPLPLGVPAIAPVVGLSVTPSGRVPTMASV